MRFLQKLIVCFLLILLQLNAVWGDDYKKPEACVHDDGGNPDFGEIHKLQSGAKLYVCGYKSRYGFHGAVFFQSPAQTQPNATSITMGGTSEAYGPFSVMNVDYKFISNGIVITDLIPLDDSQWIPSIQRTIICENAGCTELKRECVFKKQKNKNEKKSFELLQAFLKIKGKALPSRNDIMNVYRNALSGDRKSIEILLNQKFLDKMDTALIDQGDNPEGDAHRAASATISKLRTNKCL